MTARHRLYPVLLGGFIGIALTWFGVSASNPLGGGTARDVLARLTGNYPPKQIHVRRIYSGLTANEALVEAEIDATFKFSRENGQWRATEVRLGDQQWQSLDALTNALAQARRERTEADLHILAAGLERYRAKFGGYVVAPDIAKLTDRLAPDFVTSIIRRDGWNRPLIYSGTSASYRLQSFGPDGKSGTPDDITLSVP